MNLAFTKAFVHKENSIWFGSSEQNRGLFVIVFSVIFLSAFFNKADLNSSVVV
jgi:hypothetical protein